MPNPHFTRYLKPTTTNPRLVLVTNSYRYMFAKDPLNTVPQGMKWTVRNSTGTYYCYVRGKVTKEKSDWYKTHTDCVVENVHVRPDDGEPGLKDGEKGRGAPAHLSPRPLTAHSVAVRCATLFSLLGLKPFVVLRRRPIRTRSGLERECSGT